MSWSDYLIFPVAYRRWLIQRINKEIKEYAERGNNIPSKAAHHNTPDLRSLTGKARHMVPAKLRRFT